MSTNDETQTPTAQEQPRPSFFRRVKELLLPGKQDTSLRDAIEELIEEGQNQPAESSVAIHERRLISNILKLRDLPVVEVMVPRADIVAIDITTPREELYKLLTEKPHSRIPIYQGDLDNIIGIMHMKDIVSFLASGRAFETKNILRDMLVVSPAMRVLDLLLQMRQSRVHIAMVVDEFGGIDGLITINDLVEAIVGEIDDDYGFEIEPQVIERIDGSLLADARFPIDEFEEKYGHFLSEDELDEVDTLAGLVTLISGHMPARGEIIKHASGMEFEVIDADPRRINRIRIRNLPQREEKQPAANFE